MDRRSYLAEHRRFTMIPFEKHTETDVKPELQNLAEVLSCWWWALTLYFSPYVCNSSTCCCPVKTCHLWQSWVVGFQSCWELRAELWQLRGQTEWTAVPHVMSFTWQVARHNPPPLQITNDDLCRKSPCREQTGETLDILRVLILHNWNNTVVLPPVFVLVKMSLSK